jgi:hypothetical protein
MERFFKTVPSPLGDLKVVASDRGLTAILWPNEDPKRVRLGDLVECPDHPVLRYAEQQLQELSVRSYVELGQLGPQPNPGDPQVSARCNAP